MQLAIQGYFKDYLANKGLQKNLVEVTKMTE